MYFKVELIGCRGNNMLILDDFYERNSLSSRYVISGVFADCVSQHL